MSTLYIVATPIGNLEDITLRALRVLKEADMILCEDTRVTQRLLKRYGVVNKQLTTYNTQRSGIRIEKIIGWLTEGKNLALVSDAGTPAISDPGVILVREVRARLGKNVSIQVIPGPSAVIAALSGSGLPASEFLFLGFLPHKKGRETLFREIAASERTVVFYESPHRIMKTLHTLSAYVSVNRYICVAREMTKIYESFIRGTAKEVEEHFIAHPDQIRGEYVVIVAGK